MENAQGHYVPTNNSCERGLRAEVRAYLLGREINGGRRPVEPDRPVKFTAEQAAWLNTVCDHAWPEYGALLAPDTLGGHDAQLWFWVASIHKHKGGPARLRRAYPARLIQELLNRLDEDRVARDAAEFDRECAAELPGAWRTRLGQTIVRDIVGATGKDTTDAHRYGALAEDTPVIRPTGVPHCREGWVPDDAEACECPAGECRGC